MHRNPTLPQSNRGESFGRATPWQAPSHTVLATEQLSATLYDIFVGFSPLEIATASIVPPTFGTNPPSLSLQVRIHPCSRGTRGLLSSQSIANDDDAQLAGALGSFA